MSPSEPLSVTPAALGTAPAGLASTGDPIMCTLWTLAGMPAISLPLLRGANGMPLGVQLVGRRGDDGRLTLHATAAGDAPAAGGSAHVTADRDRTIDPATGLVMATHDQAIVDAMRKRVVELDQGRVVRDQSRGVYS